jgi:type IV pilus assembly protein PilO
VSGRYHDIGSFAADIANLSRIVTLHNMNIAAVPKGDGALGMEATARTYRYLDPAEVETMKAEKAKAAKGRPGAAGAKK